jgi:outer membrane protein TolC
MRLSSLLCLCFLLIVTLASAAPPQKKELHSLSLEQYLDQVREGQGAFRAASAASRAAALKARESETAFAYTLFGNLSNTRDNKAGTVVPYDKTILTNLQLGVSKLTPFGLTARAYYHLHDQQFDGLKLAGYPTKVTINQASPVVELSLSLWRNRGGRETSAIVAHSKALGEVSALTSAYQRKHVLVQATATYWQLVLVREMLRLDKSALQRSQQMREWHQRRVADSLGDRIDLLQAEAAEQQGILMLRHSEDALAQAQRAFNLARNRESAEVSEELLPLSSDYFAKLSPPRRQAQREDVKAAAAQLRLSEEAARLSEEKYRPTLELYGSVALNNADPAVDVATAARDSFALTRPSSTIGLRVNAPLGNDGRNAFREGLISEQLAAHTIYTQKLREEENDWANLQERFQRKQGDIRDHLALEQKQREKYAYELKRRSAGRTTTQQVLLFKGDYESAQRGTIQAMNELCGVYAQMKLFAEVPDESR